MRRAWIEPRRPGFEVALLRHARRAPRGGQVGGCGTGPISGDSNGHMTDIFRRTLSEKAGTRDSMQMASYSYAEKAQADGESRHP